VCLCVHVSVRPFDLSFLCVCLCVPMSVFSRLSYHFVCVCVCLSVYVSFRASVLSFLCLSMFVGRCTSVSRIISVRVYVCLYQFSSVCLIFSVCVTLFSQCSSFRITISVFVCVCVCVRPSITSFVCVFMRLGQYSSVCLIIVVCLYECLRQFSCICLIISPCESMGV